LIFVALASAGILLGLVAGGNRPDAFALGVSSLYLWFLVVAVNAATRRVPVHAGTVPGPPSSARGKGGGFRMLRRMAGFLRDGMARGALGIGFVLVAALLAWFHRAAAVPVPSSSPRNPAVAYLVLAFLFHFSGHVSALAGGGEGASRLSALVREGASWLFGVSLAAAGVAFAAEQTALPARLWAGWGFAILTGCLAAETAARAAFRLYQPERVWRAQPDLGRPLLFLRRSRAGDDPAAPGFSGVRLSRFWIIREARRLLLPFAACVAAVVWAASALHVVPGGSVGVRERFGRFDETVCAPGPHVTLPYPLERLRLVDTARLRELVLGMDADPGEPILWATSHYQGEKALLAGGGESFLTVAVPLLYRVTDPLTYLRHVQAPEEALARIAGREVQRRVLGDDLFGILTSGRSELEEDLRSAIQRNVDAARLGIRLEQVCLRDIHPPVATADAFQDVVSAEEDRQAALHLAQSYQQFQIPEARALAFQETAAADAYARSRVVEESGRAAGFLTRRSAYAAAPDLFRLRTELEAREEALHGTKKVIVDRTLSPGNRSVIDLRRVMNPLERRPLASPKESLVPGAPVKPPAPAP
jgi:membrane protease subunit HflK